MKCTVTCNELDENKFILGLYSTLAVKKNLILKKQQVRGPGNLLLATTLVLGCSMIDRYCRLSMNVTATWKCGRRHLPWNISLVPVLLLQTVSQVPAPQGIRLSLVVSHNKSVEIPFWFPTQWLSLKVKMELKFMLSYLPKFQCHSSFCHCSFKGADSPWKKQRSRRRLSGSHFYCIAGRNPLLKKPLLKKPNS